MNILELYYKEKQTHKSFQSYNAEHERCDGDDHTFSQDLFNFSSTSSITLKFNFPEWHRLRQHPRYRKIPSQV